MNQHGTLISCIHNPCDWLTLGNNSKRLSIRNTFFLSWLWHISTSRLGYTVRCGFRDPLYVFSLWETFTRRLPALIGNLERPTPPVTAVRASFLLIVRLSSFLSSLLHQTRLYKGLLNFSSHVIRHIIL